MAFTESPVNWQPFHKGMKIFLLLILFSLVIPDTFCGISPKSLSDDRDALVINPAYKIKRLSNGVVIAYSNQLNGETIRHEFNDIYADVLLAAVRKQSINQVLPILARKYYYPIDECRREIKHAVHVLEEWEILVPDRPLP